MYHYKVQFFTLFSPYNWKSEYEINYRVIFKKNNKKGKAKYYSIMFETLTMKQAKEIVKNILKMIPKTNSHN